MPDWLLSILSAASLLVVRRPFLRREMPIVVFFAVAVVKVTAFLIVAAMPWLATPPFRLMSFTPLDGSVSDNPTC